MILVDTNVVSETARLAPDQRVIRWLDAQAAEILHISTVTLSELLLGVEILPDGRRKTELGRVLSEQIRGVFGDRVLPFDIRAAASYATVVARARRSGRAIGVVDGQIAAIAAARGLTVATRDVAPFEAAGVPIIDPWATDLTTSPPAAP